MYIYSWWNIFFMVIEKKDLKIGYNKGYWLNYLIFIEYVGENIR